MSLQPAGPGLPASPLTLSRHVLLRDAPTALLSGPQDLCACVGATGCATCGYWGAGASGPPPSLPPHRAQCQLLPSPRPAGPKRQWCQPRGCQEACCHANGPGWVGVMVTSSSWGCGPARAGGMRKGAQQGGCCPLRPTAHGPGPRPPGAWVWMGCAWPCLTWPYLLRSGSQGDSGTGTRRMLGPL